MLSSSPGAAGRPVKGRRGPQPIQWRRRAHVPKRGALLVALAVLSLPGCALLYRGADVAYVELMAEFSPNDVQIEIHKSFIAKLMNRVSMDVDFRVEHADIVPHPAFMDGDLHFAGHSPQVGLPVVGEIINAAQEKEAVDLVHAAKRTGTPLALSGVWRIWPEHAGDVDEKQGGERHATHSPNPDHVFEIHPVTTVAGISLLDSFHPVEGFLPGAAAVVVPRLEQVHCRITVRRGDIVITTQKGLYNDLAFIMEVADDRQTVVADGRFVTASLLDTDGTVLARRRRMVFVRDTPPERAVRRLARGARLHVYGIPRIDLSEIYRRVEEHGRRPGLLDENLPYEVVIIGVFD
jgi:hypothetical protein